MNRCIVAAVIGLAVATGCQGTGQRQVQYQTVPEDPNRNTPSAREANARGLEFFDKSDPEEAEKALKEALAADMFYGPAHNNLGVVYFQQKRFYLAAWEFQYAAKLMPYSPEPRNNLGLVYEAVGRFDEAERWYDLAVRLEPDNPLLIGNLARTLVRAGRRDERTCQLLSDLVLKDEREEWVLWARERLASMHPLGPAAGGQTPTNRGVSAIPSPAPETP